MTPGGFIFFLSGCANDHPQDGGVPPDGAIPPPDDASPPPPDEAASPPDIAKRPPDISADKDLSGRDQTTPPWDLRRDGWDAGLPPPDAGMDFTASPDGSTLPDLRIADLPSPDLATPVPCVNRFFSTPSIGGAACEKILRIAISPADPTLLVGLCKNAAQKHWAFSIKLPPDPIRTANATAMFSATGMPVLDPSGNETFPVQIIALAQTVSGAAALVPYVTKSPKYNPPLFLGGLAVLNNANQLLFAALTPLVANTLFTDSPSALAVTDPSLNKPKHLVAGIVRILPAPNPAQESGAISQYPVRANGTPNPLPGLNIKVNGWRTSALSQLNPTTVAALSCRGAKGAPQGVVDLVDLRKISSQPEKASAPIPLGAEILCSPRLPLMGNYALVALKQGGVTFVELKQGGAQRTVMNGVVLKSAEIHPGKGLGIFATPMDVQGPWLRAVTAADDLAIANVPDPANPPPQGKIVPAKRLGIAIEDLAADRAGNTYAVWGGKNIAAICPDIE